MKALAKPVIILLLISDLNIGGNSIFKVGLLASLLLARNSSAVLLAAAPFLGLLQIVNLTGAIIAEKNLLGGILLSFAPWASLFQANAVVTLFRPKVDGASEMSKPETKAPEILLWLLVAIGALQMALGQERPQFVFYETNYIAFWIPLVYAIKIATISSSHQTVAGDWMTNIRGAYRGLAIPSLLILIMSQSLTTLFTITVLWITYLSIEACTLVPRLALTKRISQKNLLPVILILFTTIATFALINFSPLGELSLITSRVAKIISDPDAIIGLSGLRYATFEAAYTNFKELPLTSQLLGGGGYSARAFEIETLNGTVSLPLTGIYAQLTQYGYTGAIICTLKYFYDASKCYSQSKSLLAASGLFAISSIALAFLISTNLTYGCPITLITCLWVKFKKIDKAFANPAPNE